MEALYFVENSKIASFSFANTLFQHSKVGTLFPLSLSVHNSGNKLHDCGCRALPPSRPTLLGQREAGRGKNLWKKVLKCLTCYTNQSGNGQILEQKLVI